MSYLFDPVQVSRSESYVASVPPGLSGPPFARGYRWWTLSSAVMTTIGPCDLAVCSSHMCAVNHYINTLHLALLTYIIAEMEMVGQRSSRSGDVTREPVSGSVGGTIARGRMWTKTTRRLVHIGPTVLRNRRWGYAQGSMSNHSCDTSPVIVKYLA